MMKFNTYRLLNESLGMYSLGLTPVQNMGIQSNLPGFGEAGFPPEIGAKKKKPPFGGGDEEPEGGAMPPMSGDGPVPPDPMGDEMGGDLGGEEGDMPPMGDEMGGEEEMTGDEDIHAKIEELEAELEKLKAMVGHDEEEDLDADLDHDDDLGDVGADLDGAEGDIEDAEEESGEDLDHDGEEGEDEEHKDKVFGGKKPAFGGKKPAFMKKMKEGNKDDHDGKLVGGKGKDGPVFMMKKAKKCGAGMDMDDPKKRVILGKSKKMSDADDQGMMPMKKMKKHCSDGKMCKKCETKMKGKLKETTGYERPQPLDNSETAWMNSIRNQLSQISVNQKFTSGLEDLKKEDMLLPPNGGGLESVPEVKPMQPTTDDLGFTAEAVQEILARLARLEGNK